MTNCELNSKSFHTKLLQHKTIIPKPMRVFFLLIQICFSLDFGFFTYRSPRQKWFLKLVSFMQCVIVVSICITTLGGDDFYFYLKTSVEYFICCLFFIQLKSKNYFYQILKDLLALDKELGVDYHRHNIGILIIIVYIVSCVYRITNSLINCYKFYNTFCALDMSLKLFIQIPILSIDLPYIVNFGAYYSIYCRLKAFTNFVRNSEVDIVTCQYFYKRLIEITEKCQITSAFTVCLMMLLF